MWMKLLPTIFTALQAGQELANPEKWKKGQQMTNLVGGVLAGIVAVIRYQFPNLDVPPEFLTLFNEAIVAALVAANVYFTAATTKKIGL
jgi:hypothetical protein